MGLCMQQALTKCSVVTSGALLSGERAGLADGRVWGREGLKGGTERLLCATSRAIIP